MPPGDETPARTLAGFRVTTSGFLHREATSAGATPYTSLSVRAIAVATARPPVQLPDFAGGTQRSRSSTSREGDVCAAGASAQRGTTASDRA